jgi:threonine aldolase
VIDLRSDTVTRPTAEMRAAMAAAQVGDDDYREDPTVIRLEERAAELLGKEGGLFVPSGVMSNLIAALTHCPDDQRVVALDNSHIAWSLSGNPRIARLTQLITVPSEARGLPSLDALQAAFATHGAVPVGLLCYENTHNLAGGTALAPGEMDEMITVARRRGIPIHLDGARLFNAAVALDLPASALAAEADSVTFCVSKGLGAPVGSVLCGDGDFIAQARDYRKYLGGAMRQAGIVAAAGLLALETMIDRLAEDHANARWLAERLAQIPGLTILPEHIETNIIFVELTDLDPAAFRQELLTRGVAVTELGGRIRLVTHLDVNRPMLARAVEIIAEVVSRQPLGHGCKTPSFRTK